MLWKLALASATVLPCSTVAAREESGALPMAHGIYVESSTQCAAASNSTIVSFWGDQLNSAHIVGHIRTVTGGDDIYIVTLNLEGDSGMGSNLRDQVEWQIITDEGGALLIDAGDGATLYRWCAASMDDLDQMRQQQAQTPPALPKPAPVSLSDDAPAFMGIWGYAFAPGENLTGDGIELDMCADFNTIAYKAEEAENMHALFEYESYAEIAPGHWRIDAVNVYEGSRFPLTIDLYVEGDTMREVTTSKDGREQEAELVRCE